MTINALRLGCQTNVFHVSVDSLLQQAKLFFTSSRVCFIHLGTDTHLMHKGRALRRNSPRGFRPTVKKGSNLRRFVSSNLFAPETVGRHLHGHLHVGIGRKSRLLDEIASISVKGLHIQGLPRHESGEFLLGCTIRVEKETKG